LGCKHLLTPLFLVEEKGAGVGPSIEMLFFRHWAFLKQRYV